MKCEIRWIDAHGNKTPDDNEAIGVVWMEAYVSDYGEVPVHIKESKKYYICAEHAKRLPLPHWHFEPL